MDMYLHTDPFAISYRMPLWLAADNVRSDSLWEVK